MWYKFLILFVFGINTLQIFTQQDVQREQEEWVTVLVHGTIMPYFNLFDLKRLTTAKTPTKTKLERIHKLYRKTPFFFLAQPIQDTGLRPVYFASEPRESAPEAFATVIHLLNKEYRPERIINHFYTFGWSGLLNEYARKEGAQLLWKQLCQEISKLKKTTTRPLHICLIGYSYGAALCLSLAENAEQQNCDIIIDELDLYAMPIRYESYEHIYSPLFKKIYLMYSTGDRIQMFDTLSGPRPNNIFDSKISQEICEKDLPKNLKQIKVSLNSRVHPFKEAKEYPLFARQSKDPGHIEMWLFGWTLKWYRPCLPICPLPVAAFTPFLTAVADSYSNHNHVNIELSPKSGQTIIKTLDTPQKDIFYRYDLTPEKCSQLQGIGKAFRPSCFCTRYKKNWNTLLRKLERKTKKEQRDRCLQKNASQSRVCRLSRPKAPTNLAS
jgi:hypothetical protein